MERIAPAYAPVSARWNDYLATLEDDEIALVTDAIRHATTINREEIDALRGMATAPRPKVEDPGEQPTA